MCFTILLVWICKTQENDHSRYGGLISGLTSHLEDLRLSYLSEAKPPFCMNILWSVICFIHHTMNVNTQRVILSPPIHHRVSIEGVINCNLANGSYTNKENGTRIEEHNRCIVYRLRPCRWSMKRIHLHFFTKGLVYHDLNWSISSVYLSKWLTISVTWNPILQKAYSQREKHFSHWLLNVHTLKCRRGCALNQHKINEKSLLPFFNLIAKAHGS